MSTTTITTKTLEALIAALRDYQLTVGYLQRTTNPEEWGEHGDWRKLQGSGQAALDQLAVEQASPPKVPEPHRDVLLTDPEPEVPWTFETHHDSVNESAGRIYHLAGKLSHYSQPEHVREVGRAIHRHAAVLFDRILAKKIRDKEAAAKGAQPGYVNVEVGVARDVREMLKALNPDYFHSNAYPDPSGKIQSFKTRTIREITESLDVSLAGDNARGTLT